MPFNWVQYSENYPELKIKSYGEALRHYISIGKREGKTDLDFNRYPIKIAKLPQEQLSFTSKVPSPGTTSPSTVDLRSRFKPCYDQGNLGSCTAQALCAAYQFLTPSMMASRLFIYYNERMIEGTTRQDAGAYIHDGIDALKKYGVCQESMWPYIISKFATKPPANCYTSALAHKIVKYFNVKQTMSDMKGYLQAGYPFIVGILVYSSFVSNQASSTGMIPMPPVNKKDYILGGHCVLVCGYSDTLGGGVWICRNSWGTNWGDHGYFYLPYPYLTNTNLNSDNWCIESDTN